MQKWPWSTTQRVSETANYSWLPLQTQNAYEVPVFTWTSYYSLFSITRLLEEYDSLFIRLYVIEAPSLTDNNSRQNTATICRLHINFE